MSVVPITESSYSDDNHGIYELCIVVDSDIFMTVVAGGILIKVLRDEVGMVSISAKFLKDEGESKNTLRCKKVIFLSGVNYAMKEMAKYRWIKALHTNMKGTPFYVYAVNLMESPLDEPWITPNQREIIGYESLFLWLPFVLRFIFGTIGADLLGLMIVDIAKTESSSLLVNTINTMLNELGLCERSGSLVILIHDVVNAEYQQVFRQAKLNGTLVHSLSINPLSEFSNDNSWFTSRQSFISSPARFILRLMLDLGLIDVEDELHVTDKIPAFQIATPIRIEEHTQSSVTLRWKGLTEHTDKSRIVVNQRSDIASEWSQIGDPLPGTTKTYTVDTLQRNIKYQFSLVVESYDNVSEPTLSEWISIEKSGSLVGNLLLKVLLVVLLIFVVILDLPEIVIAIAAYIFIFFMGCLVSVLSFCMMGEKVIDFIYADKTEERGEEVKKELILVTHIVFLVAYLSAGWIIPEIVNEGETTPFISPTYIVPSIYMLLWSVTANIVCYKFFECRNGVLSLPGRIWNSLRSLGFKLREHVSTEVETVLTVRDIE